jgi:hypothetical protein
MKNRQEKLGPNVACVVNFCLVLFVFANEMRLSLLKERFSPVGYYHKKSLNGNLVMEDEQETQSRKRRAVDETETEDDDKPFFIVDLFFICCFFYEFKLG